MADFTIKRGDTAPALIIECVGADLSLAAAVRVIGARSGNKVIDHVGSGDDQGLITYLWDAADTAQTGLIEMEVEVTWPDGRIQTFPSGERYLTVLVTADLA